MIENNILKKQLDFVSHPKIHGKQKDIAKQPYIYHLLRVRMFAAKIIRSLLANEKISKQDDVGRLFINNILETAMLHDVLEDCDLSNIQTNEALQEYWETIPSNVMKAMQCLNKNNYSNKEEYIKNIISIKSPYSNIDTLLNKQSSAIKTNISHDDIVPYIVLIVKMADTLDNMNIFRLTNSFDTFHKMFPTYIQNCSTSALNNNKDDALLAFEEFKTLSNDKKMDFVINQLTHEYKNENSFIIKTINRLNNYWTNWDKYSDCYQFVF